MSIKSLFGRCSRLRRVIGQLFQLKARGRIILTSSSLIGLRFVFQMLGVESVMLSSLEYYNARSFRGLRVNMTSPAKLVAEVRRRKPKAVILSTVSWRGQRLDVQSLFHELRKACGKACPLLIADDSHAGAAGFQSASSLGADIVFGVPTRWLSQSVQKDHLGFLWVANAALYKRISPAFEAFFLALDRPPDSQQSRWIEPRAIEEAVELFDRLKLSKNALQARHDSNMELARVTAAALKLASPESALLVAPATNAKHPLVQDLRKAGLVWDLPDGKMRIMCRADLFRTIQPQSQWA